MFRIRVSRVEELMGDAFQGCGKPKPPWVLPLLIRLCAYVRVFVGGGGGMICYCGPHLLLERSIDELKTLKSPTEDESDFAFSISSRQRQTLNNNTSVLPSLRFLNTPPVLHLSLLNERQCSRGKESTAHSLHRHYFWLQKGELNVMHLRLTQDHLKTLNCSLILLVFSSSWL